MSRPLPPGRPARQGARGLSLVEVLVSLVLGLAVLLGVVSLYLANRDLLRSHEGVAQIQENGRFAFERLLREVRQAGHVPCGTRLDANTLRNKDSATMAWWADTDGSPLRVFGSTQATAGIVASGSNPGERLAGTGAILVLRPSDDPDLLRPVLDHDRQARRFTLSSVGDLRANDIVMACDGLRSALFQATAVNASARSLEHQATGLNCTDRLGGVGLQCLNPFDAMFRPELGAFIARWDPAFWYVGANDQGTRSLYRIGLNAGGGSSTNPGRQEMVRDVHDLQAEALTRDEVQGGTLAPDWRAPADLPPGNPATDQVVSLRITLTLRSGEKAGTDGQPLERRMVAVATLRNRDW